MGANGHKALSFSYKRWSFNGPLGILLRAQAWRPACLCWSFSHELPMFVSQRERWQRWWEGGTGENSGWSREGRSEWWANWAWEGDGSVVSAVPISSLPSWTPARNTNAYGLVTAVYSCCGSTLTPLPPKPRRLTQSKGTIEQRSPHPQDAFWHPASARGWWW